MIVDIVLLLSLSLDIVELNDIGTAHYLKDLALWSIWPNLDGLIYFEINGRPYVFETMTLFSSW